jgi:hypothetical protein
MGSKESRIIINRFETGTAALLAANGISAIVSENEGREGASVYVDEAVRTAATKILTGAGFKVQEDAEDAEETETLKPETLPAHFKKRRDALKTLDKELEKLGQKLIALVPEELKAFKDEALWDIKAFLVTLENNSRQGSCNDIKFKQPSDYGFRGKKDVIKKMELLKEAWEGIVDVEINTRDWYVQVRFRLPPEHLEIEMPFAGKISKANNGLKTENCIVIEKIDDSLTPEAIISTAVKFRAYVDNEEHEEAGDDTYTVQFPGHGQESLDKDGLTRRIAELKGEGDE